MTGSGRLVLADFGGGLLYRQPPPAELRLPLSAWRPIEFRLATDAMCCNPMAWDPHVSRLSRSGPSWEHPCLLEDVYAKSDLFAVGRMVYDALLPEGTAFPSSSAARPSYRDDEVRVCSRDVTASAGALPVRG